MKKLIALAALAATALTGCSHTNISKLSQATGNDHATLKVDLVTPWGTEHALRVNPNTNQSVTISPDGTVTITSK